MDEVNFASWLSALGVSAIVIWLIRTWPVWKQRITEAKANDATIKGGDWDRLRTEIARLDERCDHLQKEVDDCREREGEWMRRAIAAEAAHLGTGEAHQEAQRIVSAERERDAKKRKQEGGGGR